MQVRSGCNSRSVGSVTNFSVSSSPPSAGPQELHDAHAGGRGAVGSRPLHRHHHTQDAGTNALPQRRTDGRRRRRDQRVRGRGLHPSRLSQTPGATSLSPGVAPQPSRSSDPPTPPLHPRPSESPCELLRLLSSSFPRPPVRCPSIVSHTLVVK